MDNDLLKDAAKDSLKGTKYEKWSLDNKDLTLLSGWVKIAAFIVEAKISIEHAIELNKNEKFEIRDFVLATGMYKNFVMSYSKCFNSAGIGNISLDAKDIYKDKVDLLRLHNVIMNARNTYVAHNDHNNSDVTLSLTSEDDNSIVLAQVYTVSTPINEFNDYKNLISVLEDEVIYRFNKKVDKIQTKIGKNIFFE
ncbi:hypothetical protein [Chitinophaga nivalis]|uniref:HEPN AbiU2-like domain-containing protein n=1 Tax=Chitinophaga nivalis TaxID=2991709 RepID=A0ABT3IJ13_9BACT|nr:hypothetical protein [Chitinophaga nivalis]MCW3466363.1 hypothetical protein [Chitinophaga nivalis]MCW3483946.1 hypothetical protein [Chitinophaga nivalis]